jgi:hypothetical protein
MIYLTKDLRKTFSMRALENENDPRIFKELIKMIVADNEKKQKLIDQILKQKSKAEQNSFSIEESLAVLRKKYFGKSSEKSADRQRSRNDDEEVLLHSQNLLPPIKNKSAKKLIEEIKIHDATAEELTQASIDFGIENPSADQWQKIENLFDESTEIEIVKRSYKKIIHKRQKYKLKKEFNQTEKKMFLYLRMDQQNLFLDQVTPLILQYPQLWISI